MERRPTSRATIHLKVAFVTPEFQSLVRRTSLAEISEYLPRALAREGADVTVFLPFTKEIETDKLSDFGQRGEVCVSDGDRRVTLSLQQGRLGDLQIVLVGHDGLFRSRHPYGDDNGPYPDNWRRYAIFSRAVLESFDRLGMTPDILHCMDWTTGLIPVYHKLEYGANIEGHPTERAGTFFGVHNLAMQGSFERSILPKIRISHEYFRAIDGIELGGKVNYLKAGAEFATIVGTHSPAHVESVQNSERGDGLDKSFRRRKKELVGIVNGIDYRAWDPTNDPLLPQEFGTHDTELAGKKRCKAHLQASLKLDNGPRTPLICIIGRFDSDSGFDILAEALIPILERNVQLVMMGPGQPNILERMRNVESNFTARCRVIEGYHLGTAHALMGGADILMMPAHYNPSSALCAIAMRYGVTSIAYAHGGLQDLIVDHARSPSTGTGFTFHAYTTESLLDGLDNVRNLYKKPTEWRDMVHRCLGQDFSWRESARNYLKAYRRVTRRIRGRKS
ncbi:MAG: starch synthase [Planctomycetota bacterium]|jgi:starch synthase